MRRNVNDAEKVREVKKLLAYVYAEWGKAIDDALVAFWLRQLKGVDRKLAWKAAEELAKRKTYGEPKFQDFWAVLNEIAPTKKIQSAYHPYTGVTEYTVKIGLPQRGPSGNGVTAIGSEPNRVLLEFKR